MLLLPKSEAMQLVEILHRLKPISSTTVYISALSQLLTLHIRKFCTTAAILVQLGGDSTPALASTTRRKDFTPPLVWFHTCRVNAVAELDNSVQRFFSLTFNISVIGERCN